MLETSYDHTRCPRHPTTETINQHSRPLKMPHDNQPSLACKIIDPNQPQIHVHLVAPSIESHSRHHSPIEYMPNEKKRGCMDLTPNPPPSQHTMGKGGGNLRFRPPTSPPATREKRTTCHHHCSCKLPMRIRFTRTCYNKHYSSRGLL